MNDDRSLERAARSWLEAGPTQAPDRAVEAALLQIETTSQERDLRIPWRLPKMITPARVATAAVIGVLAVGGTFFVLNRPPQGIVGMPSTPTPAPTSSPAARLDYSDLTGRILVEHLGNALDLSESGATESNPDRRRFYFMDPADMTSKTAVEFLPGQPANGKSAADISSDGKKIVFQDFAEQTRLYEANLDGTGFRAIPVDCTCALLYPDYDPTATRIVYVRVEGFESWLEIRDLATNKVTKLVVTVGPAADAVPEQPAWSPDGKTIAFSRLTWGSDESLVVGTIHYGDKPPTAGLLSMLDVATGKVTDLTLAADQLPGDANWSPDSSLIVFTSGPASTTGSNAGMSSDGGTRRINADGTGFNTLPGWGGPEYLPDGEHILYQDNTMFVMRADGTDALPVNIDAMDLSEGPQGFAYIGHWVPDAP